MPKKGICPECNRGPRTLQYRHPETREVVCQNCYKKATGKKSPKRIGICSNCEKGPKEINYRHPQTKEPICHNCHSKIKRREKRLAIPRAVKIQKPPAERLWRENPYPTEESVIKALADRIKEGKQNYAVTLNLQDATLYRRARHFKVVLPKKEIQRRRPTGVKRVNEPARLAQIPAIREEKENVKEPEKKEKYPNRKSVIAALEDREAQGKENLSDILNIDDVPLYQAVLEFEVELPKKEDFPVRYYRGDLVKNQNSKNPSVCGRIGQVVFSDEKEVIVDFKEPNGIKRVYQKWYNLNNIILHARNPRSLAEIAKKKRPDLVKSRDF